jgi:DDE superfamily endonuclease
VVPHRVGEAAAQGRRGRGPRSGRDRKKGLIEQAYAQAERPVWTQDEAGPYQAIPQPGTHWRPATSPARYPHEHIRHGTAKLLTLFHPASGRVHVKGVTSAANAVLHPWLETELTAILATLPEPPAQSEAERRAAWERWQEGLTIRFTLPERLPPLRLLLVFDNLSGHKTPSLVLWLVEHGVMPLYTPLSGSWLNMAESIQRILVRRALAGQAPDSPDEIIDWLEATARGWNADPTPFEWAGKRRLRRQRSRQRHQHALGGSGACTRRPVHRRPTTLDQWRRSCQVTH